MRKLSLYRRFIVLGAVVPVTALLAAGCGNGNGNGTAASSPTPESSQAEVASIAAQVPSATKARGTLTVAADATYAPNEFIASDGTTVIGMDTDLSKAIGQVLGLKVTMVNATFDTIIPGIVSGKYDMGASSFTDTRAREKTVNFVTYFRAGTSFYVKASGGPAIASLADLCGHTVAAERGTVQQDDAMAQAVKCRAAGKPGVTVQTFNDQNGVNLALNSGRADVAMADSPVADYQVKLSNGMLKLSGSAYSTEPYGLAVAKDSGLAEPVLAALKHLIADGTYMKILTKWGIQRGAISTPVINGAIS